MKQLFSLSFLLIFSGMSFINGQISKEQSNHPWSFSLSYAPKFEIRRPINRNSQMFFKSINIMTDYRFKDHFSIAFGLDYCQNTESDKSLNFNGSTPTSYMLYRTSFTEFPIQLNYHFSDYMKNLDPYLKTSLRSIYYHYYYRRESSQDYYTAKSDNYFLFCDLGFGSYLKVRDKISLMFQASIGFGLKYHTPQYTYFEGLVGFRYSLTKMSN